jgi:hypothetical protein
VSNSPLVEAGLVALRSDVMLGAAVLTVGAVYAAGAAIRSRALDPGLHWRQAFVSGAHDEAFVLKSSLRVHRASRTTLVDEERIDTPVHNSARLATLVTAAFLGLIGALALTLSGHPPAPIIALAPAVIAASIAMITAARISKPTATRSILANRGARLLASAVFVEVSSAFAMVVTVAVVTHTAGLTAISLVEVAAITLATRLAVSLTPWPGGVGVADAVMLLPLMWIGVPLHVGLAAVLIWRAGSLLAVSAAFVIARTTRAVPSNASGATSGDGGRLLHRALFATLGFLPRALRHALRRRVFDALFSLSDDPWRYEQTAYEHRKRQHLLMAVGAQVHTIIEVGCADGHNLRAVAQANPHATIIGTDVSPIAVDIASRHTSEFPNVRVVRAEQLSRIGIEDRFDCVILAEVLYYLGSERAMRETLQPVRDRMSDACRVILLHGSADAPELHARAARAMGLRTAEHQHINEPERPFLVTIATPTEAPAGPEINY